MSFVFPPMTDRLIRNISVAGLERERFGTEIDGRLWKAQNYCNNKNWKIRKERKETLSVGIMLTLDVYCMSILDRCDKDIMQTKQSVS